LIAALGSWLDARAAHGRWLVRIEDLDRPRCVPGADHAILRALARLGLHWDGDVLYQSERPHLYRAALEKFVPHTYSCGCPRRQILLQRRLGLSTPRYLHLPVGLDAAGDNLSKQTAATPIEASRATLERALSFLGQPPAASLDEAVRNWNPALISRRRAQALA